MKTQPPELKWAMENCRVDGADNNALRSFCDGSLHLVTDGSHHPALDLATAAVAAESSEGDVLAVVAQAPWVQEVLQLHGADLGNTSSITIDSSAKLPSFATTLRY